MAFLIDSLGQPVPRIDEHIQAVRFQKLLDILISASLRLVVEPLLIDARPQQVNYHLTVPHFHRPHYLLYLGEIFQVTDSAINAEELVFQSSCQGKAVKKVVYVVKGAADLVNVLAKSNRALFPQPANSIN